MKRHWSYSSGESEGWEVSHPLSKHHGCVGGQHAQGGRESMCPVPVVGELGSLKFSTAGVQGSWRNIWFSGRTGVTSSSCTGDLGTDETRARSRESSWGVQTLCEWRINCNNLGFLDFLIYKIRVEKMAIKAPCTDWWSHLRPTDSQDLWLLLSRPRKFCFFDVTISLSYSRGSALPSNYL